jgi:hypothetical protein
VPALADQAALDWEAAFPVESAARDVYVEAHYLGSDGVAHRLQLWRHGTEFLHRRTDEALDLYLSQAGSRGDYAYRLIDHRRRLSMDVKRNQLYRIGVFSDWFGLAHVLDRPKSEYVVRAVSPLSEEVSKDRRSARQARMDCSWRLLVSGGKESPQRSRICWSAQWGVPLAIRTRGSKGEWIERFVVDQAHGITTSATDAALPPFPEGYAHFDAGKEIDIKQED